MCTVMFVRSFFLRGLILTIENMSASCSCLKQRTSATGRRQVFINKLLRRKKSKYFFFSKAHFFSRAWGGCFCSFFSDRCFFCPRTDVKIKDAAKKIGKQFACGSSVSKAPSGAEEVVIQGDVLMDLPGFLETTFNVRRERERKMYYFCPTKVKFGRRSFGKVANESILEASSAHLPPHTRRVGLFLIPCCIRSTISDLMRFLLEILS